MRYESKKFLETAHKYIEQHYRETVYSPIQNLGAVLVDSFCNSHYPSRYHKPCIDAMF